MRCDKCGGKGVVRRWLDDGLRWVWKICDAEGCHGGHQHCCDGLIECEGDDGVDSENTDKTGGVLDS